MSKNLTRKGLALGAILALGSSLFAGTAAHAADELTLAPATGTAYKTIAGESFTLLAGLAPATPAGNTVQLKYQVVTTATISAAQTTSSGAGAANATTSGATQPTNTTVYVPAATPVAGATQTLALTVATVTAGTPATAAVTAFFDANNNGLLDSGEYTSATRTVTWVNVADVVATVSLTTPSVGDAAIKGSVVLNDLNQEQISRNHLAFLITTASGTLLTGTTDATTGASSPFTYAAGTNQVVAAALASGSYGLSQSLSGAIASTTGGVKIAVYYLGTASGASSYLTASASQSALANTLGTLLGSSTKAIVARTASAITASAAASANNTYTAGTSNGSSTVTTRTDSAFTVSAKVVDTASTPAALAGAAVLASITLAGGAPAIDSTHTITVNGTTYSTASAFSTAQTAGWALTTAADGTVSVTINTVGFAVGNTFAVAFATQGYTSTVTATNATIAYTLVQDKATVSANVTRTVVKGDSYAVSYTLVDQFKQVPATGNYRLNVTATAGAGVAAGSTYVALSAGKGTATYATTATGSFTVAPAVEVQNSTTLNWGAQAATVPATITVNVIAAQTDAATATVAYDGVQTSANVASAAEKAVDTRTSFSAIGVYTAAETAVVSGGVTNSVSGVGRSGSFVTVSGAGLLFANAATTGGITSATIFTADSITVPADSSGNYAVAVVSNVAGSFTVTVASGNATKTATVKFASTLAAATVTLATLPAQAQAGQAVAVSATTADKYGNAVSSSNVTFTLAGVGYLQTVAAVTPSATGVATNRLIVGAADLGTATVTATITVSSVDITSAKSVEFGVTDADVTVGGRAVYASYEFAKGKTVTVSVDGKRLYSKLVATDAYTELKFTQKTAGKHVVTVRISGGIVYSESVVTTK